MVVGTAESDPSSVHCRVAQGSMLGLLLLCMHTMPAEDIIPHHGLQYMVYADDK